MTGALTPLTPREFAERALVGALLWQPGRIIDIAAWLDAEDFRTPANGAVFRHLRDAVAEACARVEWPSRTVDAPDPETTDAEEALRTVMGIADDLREVREHPSDRVEADIEAARHIHADAAARAVAAYPGLLQRLDAVDRREIRSVLPVASVNPYAVPGVDVVSLFERISTSGEPGDRTITAPFLHTLMATAPATSTSQPEAYGQMVLEASLRREVHRSGMRVAQAAETTTELAGLLAAVETAVKHLDAAAQRWDAVAGQRIGSAWERSDSRSLPQRVDPDSLASRLDLVASVPDDREVTAAEETVLAAVLVRPDMLGVLAERLYPEDFADDQLGAAFRAAIDVHTTARATGQRVDPVTVAWEQQRHSARHGPGVPVDRLMRIVERGPVGDVDYAVEVVMRGRLGRLTADAATAVQQAAQHPGLQPADVLHTTRLAYDAVRSTVARMSGEPTVTAPTEIDEHPNERPDQAAGRSSAQVIQLRRRAARLRTAVATEPHVAHQPDQTERDRDTGQTTEQTVEPDF